MLCVSCMCICMIWTNHKKVKANRYTAGVALQHWLWIWGTSDRRRRHYFPSPHRTRWPCYAAQPAPTTQPTIYYAAKHSTVWTIYYVLCTMQYAVRTSCTNPYAHYATIQLCTIQLQKVLWCMLSAHRVQQPCKELGFRHRHLEAFKKV